MELQVGRCYRAKVPGQANGFVNDRQVIWMSADGARLQFDGPAIRLGGKYKELSSEQFMKWAGRDVTSELPSGEWQSWRDYLIKKAAGSKP